MRACWRGSGAVLQSINNKMDVLSIPYACISQMPIMMTNASRHTHQRKSSAGVFARKSIHQHICLWSNDRRVDEAQEEEAADEGADGKVGGIWVFSLFGYQKGQAG